jgi:hypothetical protein
MSAQETGRGLCFIDFFHFISENSQFLEFQWKKCELGIGGG